VLIFKLSLTKAGDTRHRNWYQNWYQSSGTRNL